jgi:ABC-2 type transport system ATP-binding protein
MPGGGGGGVSAVVAVQNLVKVYPGTRKTPPVRALEGVSFSVEQGEFFGLLGPNGAGKSTTLGCITTLVRPTGGLVTVDGVDVVGRPSEAKRRIAVVPQTRNLDRDLRVREILTYHGRYFGLPAGEREERADRLLEGMQLQEKAQARPDTLSGGLQQRLMIARALMHDPVVLLLDEPTIGLDPQARRLIWETLEALHRKGLTLILTTHYMEEADRLCQRVAIIDHGRILTVDTPAALKATLPGRILDLSVRAAAPVGPRLDGLPGVLRLETLQRDGGDDGTERLRLFVDPADGLLDRVLHAVRDGGGDLRHVSLTAPSLEDVYISLTGKERLE